MTHWVKQAEIGTGKIAIAECGVNSGDEPKMKGTSLIGLVNCRECMEEWQKRQTRRTQKMCSFCSTLLQDEDYNENDFFLACFQHKRLAQIETEKFFKENPDYTKWQVPKP